MRLTIGGRKAGPQTDREIDSETVRLTIGGRKASRQTDRDIGSETVRLTIDRLLISIFVMAAFSGAAKTCQGKILR